MQTGVYQAKNLYPEQLMWVKTGEEVTITRHGKAVARLLPVDPVLKTDLLATINELKQCNKRRYVSNYPHTTLPIWNLPYAKGSR